MDLFTASQESKTLTGTPLAESLRPRDLESFLGQVKSVGKGTLIRELIEKGQLPSLILWGPPGTGKTTFAQILGQKIKAEFVAVNAVESGAKALREIGEAARYRRLQEDCKTILFVDEIHRFNKSQQDVLLPFVEKGDLVLIGATTENPAYEINKALLSRCRLIVFERHTDADLASLGERALLHFKKERTEVFNTETWEYLLHWADGDARRYLNAIELLLLAQKTYQNIEDLKEILGSQVFGYDKDTDSHYDTVSAFIKSIRGSDANAALYYLARMLKGGENPMFIARRLVILASEDIGNADPRALSVAIAGAQAVEMIGMPECRINLGQVVTYLASAPKSNRSYMAINKALAFVESTGNAPIPLHLRSSKTQLMQGIGYGKDYQYPHDAQKGWVEQNYWPQGMEPQKFYEPIDRGFEKNILDYERWLKGLNKSSD